MLLRHVAVRSENKTKYVKMAAKTVEQIRIALRRQSLGGAEGRFAVQRTLEYLKESPIKLRNDVKEVTMNEIGDVEQNYGLRYSLYNQL